MKTGRTLQALAAEVQRQAESKKDYVAPTTSLAMEETGEHFQVADIGRFLIAELFHHQLAGHLGIPIRYYELMQQKAPTLLARNVNHWLNQQIERRMVRTLDGRARAYLSNRYRPLDNIDLMEAVLPRLAQLKLDIKSCEVTETRLYLKCITEEVQAEVVGDTICAGVQIVNSEVGHSSLKVEPFTMTLSCLNGMVHTNFGLRKYHVGRHSGDEGDDASEFYRDDTRIADDRAFFMKVQDVVEATLSPATFDKIISAMNTASSREITGKVEKVVEVVANRFGLGQGEQDSVLKHLIKGGNLNAYGLGQAVTQTSQDSENYDKASDLERVGGEIIELPLHDWDAIQKQAA